MKDRKVPAALAAAVLSAGAAVALAATGAAGASAPAVAHGEFAAQRIVVKFKAGVDVAAELTKVHGLSLSKIAAIGAQVISVPAGAENAVVTTLQKSGKVIYAERDGLVHTTALTPNDPYFPMGSSTPYYGQWGEALSHAPDAWEVTTGSAAVTIAVVDTGITPVPDLAQHLVAGWNAVSGSSNTPDTVGHGTEVAGIAAASANNGIGIAGYCWACRIMPIKVSDSTTASMSVIASGIRWATDHGAAVINISMAGNSGSSALTDAVSYANARGVVVVAAAGNNGTTTPMYPAATPGVISVAGSDRYDTLASWSTYGSWVDLAAPSPNLTTAATGDFVAVGGTSMASPLVAGIAALLRSAVPAVTPTQVRDALDASTDPVTGDHQAAHGRVNAYRAVLQVSAATAASGAPVPTSSTTLTMPSPSPTNSPGSTPTKTKGRSGH